jgi:amino acid transporter
MAVLNNLNTYVPHSWHGTLITIAIILFSTAFNTLFAGRLPFIEGVLLVLHIGGLFAIIIPVRSYSRNNHEKKLTILRKVMGPCAKRHSPGNNPNLHDDGRLE